MSQAVRRSLIASAGQTYIVLAVNFVTLIVISRILTPNVIGVAMLGIAAASIGEAMRDFGATNYVVQRQELTESSVRTAFSVALLMSWILGFATMLGAPVLANFYGDPRLVDVLRLISFVFMVYPFSGTLMAMMSRDMQFARIAVIAIVSQVIGAATTIALAVLGAAHLSFAYGALAAAVATLVLALLQRPDFWIFKPSLADWREVVRFGGFSSISILIDRASQVLPVMALGRFNPMTSIGYFSRAQSVCQLSDRLVMAAVWSVALSALSLERREGRSLKPAYLKGMGYVTALYWPIGCLLALLAFPVVNLLLGSQWLGVVPMVRLIALAMLLGFPGVLNYPVLIASGAVTDSVRVQLYTFPPCALITIAAAAYGPVALAASMFITIPLQNVIMFIFIRKHIDLGAGEFLGSLVKSAAVSLATLAAPLVIVLWAGGWELEVGLPVAMVAVLTAAASWLIAIHVVDHPLMAEISLAWRQVCSLVGCARPS